MQQNFQLHKGNAFISDMSQPPSAQTTWMREAEPTRLVWNDDETLAEERREASAKRDPEAAIASKEVSVPRATPAPTAAAAEHSFSNARKYTLLVIFCVASFFDIMQSSAIFLFTADMVRDLQMQPLNASWLINSYLLTFAAFLLFWGRVSDLYSAKPVFLVGFFGVAILNLVVSFMTNQYAYYVLRALAGIFAAATIPSAFRLIPAVFEPAELSKAFAYFGWASALGTMSGVIVAGLLSFDQARNQNAAWRYFFRLIPVVLVPFGAVAWPLIPSTSGARAGEVQSNQEKIKRFDLVGVFLLFLGVLLLILGLTLGATYGFKTAKFIAPFLLAWPLLVAFFIWEDRLPEGFALVPPSLWAVRNIPLLMFIALGAFIQWRFVLEGFLQYNQEVDGEKPILGAVRYLPLAISSIIVGPTVPHLLKRISARWILFGGYLLAAVGYVLFVFNRGRLGADYWRWDFTGFVLVGIGAVGYQALSISIMTSVPRVQSGVVGALWITSGQIGSVIALAVQSGLFTVQPGGAKNYANLQASYWFCAGWLTVMAFSGLCFFKDKPKSDDSPAPADSTAK